MPHRMNDQMQECIDRCQSCQQACLEAISHCLEKGGKHAEADHIRLLMACAEICDTSARFILLGSEHDVRVCEVCAGICEACAQDCERFENDDMMQRCADVCRRCADSCRHMAPTPAP